MATKTAIGRTVIVELSMQNQAMEWVEVSLAEAKEVLARSMAAGWDWRIPEWQFDRDGGTPGSVLQARQRKAYAAVAAS